MTGSRFLAAMLPLRARTPVPTQNALLNGTILVLRFDS